MALEDKIDVWYGLPQIERDRLSIQFYQEFFNKNKYLFDNNRSEYHRQSVRYVAKKLEEELARRRNGY